VTAPPLCGPRSHRRRPRRDEISRHPCAVSVEIRSTAADLTADNFGDVQSPPFPCFKRFILKSTTITVYKRFADEGVKKGFKPQDNAVKLWDPEGAQGHKEWLVRTPHSYYPRIELSCVDYSSFA
jgi:hypothetical protein